MTETNQHTDHPDTPTPKAPKHAATPGTGIATPTNTTPPQDSTWKRGFLILLVVFLCLGSVGIGATANWWFNKGQSNTLSSITAGEDGNTVVTEDELSIANVVDTVAPSVVSIVTSSQVRSFYGTTDQEGAGTGIIVSKDGYVMTNNHVIDGASAVSVVDSEGNLYEDVTVIGSDPLNDIAFLKIDSNTTFTPVQLGDSSTVRVGQQVVAIGNALGQYDNTVTSGILSGTNRPVTASTGTGEAETLTDLLQTDAAINSGNSGGPLLNMAGQVIGINTAVATDANGIGFAIPINAAKGVLAGVLEDGTISRGYIGVSYIDLTPEVAREYRLNVTRGAYIYTENGSAIIADSPADDAGIKSQDIIQKVNDDVIGENGGLSSIIGQYQPGETVTLTILRDGKTITLDLTLGKYSS